MSILKFSKIAVAMGEGDVITGMAVDSFGVGHFVFMSAPDDKKHQLGENAPELEGKISVEDADVDILFANLAALDHVVERLSVLRVAMVEGGAE
uniref:Uncharacterized protein n=1 Tax=Pseudomonas phage Touem01 TaxID=3138548 RepID=A0AAU6W2Z9_9VIRU